MTNRDINKYEPYGWLPEYKETESPESQAMKKIKTEKEVTISCLQKNNLRLSQK